MAKSPKRPVSNKLWSVEDIAVMVDAAAPKPGRPKTYKKMGVMD